MRQVEFTRPFAALAPRLAELAVLVDLHAPRILMAVGDEDVAVGGDRDVAGAAKRVGAITTHALRAECHQQLPAGAVLEDLLADAVSRLAVGDPEIAKAIDADAVRPREQLLAPHLEDLPVPIELDD